MKARLASQSGAVLLFALLLLVAGAFVLGGVAQLAAVRTSATEEERAGILRRVRLENSRAMARQYLLVQMFRGTAPLPATNSSEWGGFELRVGETAAKDNWWKAQSASDDDLKINPFSLLERGGFYRVQLEGFLWDGTLQDNSEATNNVPWRFQVRSRSPIAAGYSAVAQRPAALPSTPTNRAIDFTRSNKVFFGYDALPRFPVSSVTNTFGEETNGYAGFLDIDINLGTTNGFTNSQTNALVPGVSMQVVIDLAASSVNTSPEPYFRFELTDNVAPYVTTDAGGNLVTNDLPITSLVLAGAPSGADYDPVFISIPGTQINVSSLVLSNENRRMVYVARRLQGVAVPLTVSGAATGSGPWRLGLTFSKGQMAATPTLTFSGAPAIEGGVRTDAPIAGNPDLRPETDPARLDNIGDRMMWLEDNRTEGGTEEVNPPP